MLFHQWRGVFAPPGLSQGEHLAWWQSVIERMHGSDVWGQVHRKEQVGRRLSGARRLRRLVHSQTGSL